MKSRTLLWISHLTLFLYLGVDAYIENDLVNSFTEHIAYSVVLITNLPQRFSLSIPIHLIEAIIQKYPTIVVSLNQRMTLSNKKMESIKKFLALEFQEKVLKIIFLDVMNKNTTQELIDSVKFLRNLTNVNSPSKCVIILANSSNDTNFQQFFRFSWKNKLLHMTIIAVPQKHKYKNIFLTNTDDPNTTIHQYNPFNDSYSSERFSIITELFADKVSNLHGYPLNAAFVEEFPGVIINENYTGTNILDAIHGADVKLIKTLARAMNFSLNVKGVELENNHTCKCSISWESFSEKLQASEMDFNLNFISVQGPNLKGQKWKFGTFLYPHSYVVLIKQYGTSEMNIMPFYAIFGVLLITPSIALMVFMLKFDVKVWNLHNIINLLTGGSIHPEKVSERIFFCGLELAYFLFSMMIMETLLNLQYYQMNYIDARRLNDLKNAGIIPHIVNHTKYTLASSESYDLSMITEHSKTLEDYTSIDDCVTDLLSDEMGTVNGCQIYEILGKAIVKRFADNNERSISVVKEPLIPAWAALVHSPMSHYVERFDYIVRRLYEGGLVNFWIKEITGDYFKHLKYSVIKSKAICPIEKYMFKLLIFCHFMSSLIFFCEIVWLHLKKIYASAIAKGCGNQRLNTH